MRSIGKKWINEVKSLVDSARKNGLTGIQAKTSYVLENIDERVFDTWEGAYSQIRRIVSDYVMDNI